MDGTPIGRIKCSLLNWTGLAYKIPRTGKFYITLKIRNGRVALIEKTRIETRNRSRKILKASGEICWFLLIHSDRW